MRTLIRPTIVLFLIMTVITGVVYPLLVTGIAQIAFPQQAGGSLIFRQGRPIGSRLIGQNFRDLTAAVQRGSVFELQSGSLEPGIDGSGQVPDPGTSCARSDQQRPRAG